MRLRPASLALLALAAALAACGSSSSSARAACSSTSLGSTTSVPGAPLRTILRVPAGNRTRRTPLVLALHFASGNGREMEQATRLTLEARRGRLDGAHPTPTPHRVWQPPGPPQ